MKKSRMRDNKMTNRGFSLVELIIIIAIMAVLVGALAPALIRYITKSRESVYLDAADEIQDAVVNMVVEAGTKGYSIRAVTYNGTNGSTVGSGTLICDNGSGFSDMTDSSVKKELLENMISELGMGNMQLSASNGTPLQIAFSSSGAVVASDPDTGAKSEIVLSDSDGNLKAKLSYTTEDGWVITEKH